MGIIEEKEKYTKALTFAKEKHGNQKRKVSGAPYIEHPIRVAEILIEQGAKEEQVIAALLHDVIEDTPCTREEIEKEFGERVLELVDLCTDEEYEDPTTRENWEERKAQVVEKVKTINIDAVLIKTADKLANNTSLKEDLKQYGEKTWSYFHANKEQKRRHQGAMHKVFAERLGKDHPLVKRAQALYEEIFLD